MTPSAVFAEFCAFLINCPHPCVTETGEEEKEMLKRQCCTKTMPVNTELCDRKYWSRNDCYPFSFSSPSTQSLLLMLPFSLHFISRKKMTFCLRIDLRSTSQTSHRWTAGCQITYDGQLTSNTSVLI